MSAVNHPGENPAWKEIYVNVAFNTMTIIVVGLRLYSRRLTRAGFGWDDGFIVIATILVNAMLIAAGFLIKLGFGLPDHDLTLKYNLKITMIGHGFRLEFLLCICFVKLSALFFYLRVFGDRLLHCNTIPHPDNASNDKPPSKYSLAGIQSSLRLLWYFLRKPTMRSTYIILIWIVIVWSMVSVAEELTVCGIDRPMCTRQRDTDLSICVFNSVSDLLMFVLPLRPIWRLQMNKSAKIGLSIMLMMGTITIVVSFLRFEAIVHTDYAGDYNGTAMKSFNYAILEPNLAILCISLPMLQPLIRLTRGRIQDQNRLSGWWAGSCFGGKLGTNNNTVRSTGSSYPKNAHVNIELTVVSTRANGDGAGNGTGNGNTNENRSESRSENRNEKRKESKSGNRDGNFLSRARSLWSIDSHGSSQEDIVEHASHPGRRPAAGSDASSLNREIWPFSPMTGVTTTTITAGKK
ncbi:hypothetical protein F5Y10DRAFT_286790 [Nemania abortiva]|nr:hypothetical protein F5Y10DRAFT_286790 [Nemania abortiva]